MVSPFLVVCSLPPFASVHVSIFILWIVNPSPQWSTFLPPHWFPALGKYDCIITAPTKLPAQSIFIVLPAYTVSSFQNRLSLFYSTYVPNFVTLSMHSINNSWITDLPNLLFKQREWSREVTLLSWQALFTKSQSWVLSLLRWLFWAVGLHWSL